MTVVTKSGHIFEIYPQQNRKTLSIFGRQPGVMKWFKRTKSPGLQVEIFTRGILVQIGIKAQIARQFN